ncbi:hypothetical protein [Cyanobium sp. N5-Cardenillas]|uniref:hypothetical protein n=1 Tax=Cyanobium sp. N5-Cardenillas TaxID=2823720 RepID=UPI0020CD5C70|nr:hypothetical protein [Cyanobium sp. N5-Cardenillas]
MARTLRWGVGLLLVVSLAIGAFLLLPFGSWLPGGTVADVQLGQVVNGTAFNRLFPEPDDGDQLVFTQEKRGFSEARLKHDGQVKALLAISDVTTAPEARKKFETSQSRLQGWPLVEQGPQATALLVADRFQIKVIGQGDGLEAEQRQELIGRFNLRGLAALQPASGQRAALPSGPDTAGRQSLGRLAAMEPAS